MATHYLTYDEYVDSRNVQDKQLRNEFASTRASIDGVRTELRTSIDGVRTELRTSIDGVRTELRTSIDGVRTELRSSIDAVRTELRTSINALRAEFKSELQESIDALRAELKEENRQLRYEFAEFKAETLQFQAFVRNSLLKNPTLPIHPVLRWDREKGEGINPALFPRNAKEFYSLRDPTTRPSQQMLLYLANFYDIRVVVRGGESDEESDDDEDLLQDAERTVEQLEGILGLDEDNFTRFKQRALEVAARAPGPTKRIRKIVDDDENDDRGATSRPRQSRKLDIRPLNFWDEDSEDKAGLKPGSEHSAETRLLWGSRSTPSSQRITINGLHAAAKLRSRSQPRPSGPSPHDSGSPTNPNSSPRSSRVRSRHTPESAPS